MYGTRTNFFYIESSADYLFASYAWDEKGKVTYHVLGLLQHVRHNRIPALIDSNKARSCVLNEKSGQEFVCDYHTNSEYERHVFYFSPG